MGKISPMFDGKNLLNTENILKCNDNNHFESIKNLKNNFFEYSLYDSFNFLNFNVIGSISKSISKSNCVSIVCLSSYKKIVSSFVEKLLDLDLPINKIEKKKIDMALSIYIDISNEEKSDIKLILENDIITVSNKKNFNGTCLFWAKSNFMEITLEKRLEIFLNCIYMNVLAKKVL